eukprot:TRINITY_DN112_c3_g1_i1.p2 TRINITY_DN112_c3_g1~~TRINITY_DN112_c3_g1_i1.p2  ORF type:complete len:139 (-),score=24.62 TRINITY_DN112_c3_g1_i1:543-959(-)
MSIRTIAQVAPASSRPVPGFSAAAENLSQSLGGSIYGSTPGGTRFLYKVEDMLQMRNSPLSQSPLVSGVALPLIPGVTVEAAARLDDDSDGDSDDDSDVERGSDADGGGGGGDAETDGKASPAREAREGGVFSESMEL